jgi:CubicO group peptidase (beta-lactamase class C family)
MKSERVSEFLQSRIDVKDFPSAVYLTAEKGKIVFQDALGFAVIEPEKIEARIDTIYDLASLTKPLVTGLICAKLIEKKELELGRLIDFYLAEFTLPESTKEGKYDVAIEELLAHKTFFTNWKPFYLLTENRSEVLMEIIRTPLNWEQPNVTYSDLNFLILTFLLEKIYGERIDQIAKKEIFEPLNLQNTFYNPPQELQKRIATSEKGNEYEKQLCVDLGFDVSNYKWRDYQIWGEVHDGNCYFMNGVSGHAGLFSTAEETFVSRSSFCPKRHGF